MIPEHYYKSAKNLPYLLELPRWYKTTHTVVNCEDGAKQGK